MGFRHVCLNFLLVVVLPASLSAGVIDPDAYYFVTTGHTGAQTQIDEHHTSSWSFKPASSFQLGGGIFVMKDGPATGADIILTTTNLDNNSSQTLTLTNTPFTQSYANVYFLYTTAPGVGAITISPNLNGWTVKLTSAAADHQSTAYFIKGYDQAALYKGGDTATTPLDLTQQPTFNGDIVSSPEPGPFLLISGALLMLAGFRFRRPRV